jgi:hypothetical protein
MGREADPKKRRLMGQISLLTVSTSSLCRPNISTFVVSHQVSALGSLFILVGRSAISRRWSTWCVLSSTLLPFYPSTLRSALSAIFRFRRLGLPLRSDVCYPTHITDAVRYALASHNVQPFTHCAHRLARLAAFDRFLWKKGMGVWWCGTSDSSGAWTRFPS